MKGEFKRAGPRARYIDKREIYDLCCIEPGDMRECNGDKKHFRFHSELRYELNLDLKQRQYVYVITKGSISNLRIISFSQD